MDKYIEYFSCRDDFYNAILDILSGDSNNDRANQIIDLFDDLPTADVQPVKQWISVNARLPENAKPCAVVTEENGIGVSRYMGINHIDWTLFGKRVLYWMPLPEPPKDGDSE